MLFPTLNFAIFFSLVFAESWRRIDRLTARKGMLLAASYVFYGWWDWRFTALLAGSSMMNFLAGRALGATEDPKRRQWIVAAAVTGNLLILGFFKYFGFFVESASAALIGLGLIREAPLMQILLPVGISFFTFQGISYVVDIHRGEIRHDRSLLDVFLYISFFPQLVAGPIVRAAHFLPQLDQTPALTPERVGWGVTLILMGLAKKMVLANYLATEIVDEAFFDPSAYGAMDLWMALWAYSVQLYCDFSGYSDIGIGVAALLGFHFLPNFNQPWRARSLGEFWRRWHLSLSEWLRDYLYKPLGGSRGSELFTLRNLWLTMFLAGLWHGAATTFVIWGAIMGAILVFERVTTPWRAWFWALMPGWLSAVLSTLLAFHVMALSWLLFRASDLTITREYWEGVTTIDEPMVLGTPFIALLTVIGLALHFLPKDLPERIARRVSRLSPIGLGLFLGLGIWLIEVIGPDGVAPFIYFQF